MWRLFLMKTEAKQKPTAFSHGNESKAETNGISLENGGYGAEAHRPGKRLFFRFAIAFFGKRATTKAALH